MEQLIPLINKLQDVFNAIGSDPVDLPQIAVIGSQSSGKSSVLETIVGRDFLPRGSGIVTRRPLVLQLIQIPAGDDEEGDEWGEFLHKPDQLYYDFNEIRQEIVNETDRITGKNKGISSKAINLKIYSPHVINLTMVDLPGITRVPVGDQPADIEDQIRAMLLEYISKPTTIILAVTAANTDLANSDALQLARDVDPNGTRTIGVITKIDIMDKGTNAMDMLMGKVIPLQLGYVGIVNRSQEDIIKNVPIREALQKERQFFQSHPLYRSISSRCGTPFLARTLNRILVHHIRDCLPDLKTKINKMLTEAENELLAYGDSIYNGSNSQGAILLQIITKFSNNFQAAIDGTLTELSTHELYGGARINFIFNQVFKRCLNDMDPLSGLSLDDVKTTIKNATGPKASLFVPEASFEMLVKHQIARLEEPSLQCVELVYDELQRIVSQIESKELMRFTELRKSVVEVTANLLHSLLRPTKEMIENLIKVELSFINTSHPDFIGGDGALQNILDTMVSKKLQEQERNGEQQQRRDGGGKEERVSKRQQEEEAKRRQEEKQRQQAQQQSGKKEEGGGFLGMFFGSKKNDAKSGQSGGGSAGNAPNTPAKLAPVPSTIKASGTESTEREEFETKLIQNLMMSYFDLVRKNIADLVPKSTMHFLVNEAKNSIQNELVRHLYKEEMFPVLLAENAAIAQRRTQCQEMIKTLRQASAIINEVRDFNVAAIS